MRLVTVSYATNRELERSVARSHNRCGRCEGRCWEEKGGGWSAAAQYRSAQAPGFRHAMRHSIMHVRADVLRGSFPQLGVALSPYGP